MGEGLGFIAALEAQRHARDGSSEAGDGLALGDNDATSAGFSGEMAVMPRPSPAA